MKGSLKRDLLLFAINPLGWLYGHALIQLIIFRGRDGFDFGLGTLIPGMIWAVAWSAAAMRIASKVSGEQEKINNFGLASALGVLIGFIVGAALSVTHGICDTRMLPANHAAQFFSSAFYLLGGCGLIPEGRDRSACLHIIMFAGLMLAQIILRVSSRLLKRTLVALIAVCVSTSALAYKQETHKLFLTEEAAELLNSNQRYLELYNKRSAIGQASWDEDSALTSPQHFFIPTSESGLKGGPSANSRLVSQNFFQNAVDLYKGHDKEAAFVQLGHALHLATQDMFSPPHVYDDIHLDVPIDWSPDSVEPWVLAHHAEVAASPNHRGAQPEVLTGTVSDVLKKNANETYRAVRIPGTLNADIANPVSGTLGAMFTITARTEPDCDESGQFCVTRYIWSIAGYGDCHQLRCANGTPSNDEHWWRAENFSGETASFFYFESPALLHPAFYTDGSRNGDGLSLVQLWVLDKARLLARSQESSAGLMRMFAEAVDKVSPTVELRQNNDQGSIIQPGGAGGGTIYIKAMDPAGPNPGGNPAYPNPSGIYGLELKRVSTGDAIAANPAIAAAGENPAVRTYSNLAEGEYELKAIDGLGNDTSVNIRSVLVCSRSGFARVFFERSFARKTGSMRESGASAATAPNSSRAADFFFFGGNGGAWSGRLRRRRRLLGILRMPFSRSSSSAWMWYGPPEPL